MLSNDFTANTHAEVQGERVNANPCVAFTDPKERNPSPGLGKAASGANPCGTWGPAWVAVLKGGLFLMARGLGSLVFSAAVAKAEPCCAVSRCCMGKWCLWERAGRKSGGEALDTPWFCKTYGTQLDKQ